MPSGLRRSENLQGFWGAGSLLPGPYPITSCSTQGLIKVRSHLHPAVPVTRRQAKQVEVSNEEKGSRLQPGLAARPLSSGAYKQGPEAGAALEAACRCRCRGWGWRVALAEVAQLPPRRPGPAEQRLSAGGTGTAGRAGPAQAAASPHLSRQGAAPEGAGPAAAAGEGARRRPAAAGAAQPWHGRAARPPRVAPAMSSSSPPGEQKSRSLGRLSLPRKGSMTPGKKPSALELAESTPNAHYAPLSAAQGGQPPAGCSREPERPLRLKSEVVVVNADCPRPPVSLDPRVSIYSLRKPLLSRSSVQGRVYNFLERPTGWKCFVYHFTVWVPAPPPAGPTCSAPASRYSGLSCQPRRPRCPRRAAAARSGETVSRRGRRCEGLSGLPLTPARRTWSVRWPLPRCRRAPSPPPLPGLVRAAEAGERQPRRSPQWRSFPDRPGAQGLNVLQMRSSEVFFFIGAKQNKQEKATLRGGSFSHFEQKCCVSVQELLGTSVRQSRIWLQAIFFRKLPWELKWAVHSERGNEVGNSVVHSLVIFSARAPDFLARCAAPVSDWIGVLPVLQSCWRRTRDRWCSFSLSLLLPLL